MEKDSYLCRACCCDVNHCRFDFWNDSIKFYKDEKVESKNYFKEKIFPLVYIDDVLISIGSIPDANSLNIIGKNPKEYSISKEDILKVAKENGLI